MIIIMKKKHITRKILFLDKIKYVTDALETTFECELTRKLYIHGLSIDVVVFISCSTDESDECACKNLILRQLSELFVSSVVRNFR